ncbi:hypothetical protein ADL28_03140 [Streptomyces violaceusniger]|uniref:vWA-MoxR associated protein middle region 2 domain-containing protein n=2 Tax=Streptomyces violaceusniger group TaxID=2839105 RepID=A0ABD5JN45_9ACTN|nr:hypothetical protein [Streptomyces violaceusniger]KUL66758.1 hypothetical protein ADL28_03140 [Streptomyces violaceusniger]MEE4589146.1 hypothetical protein [Streptomyces sp. DSM 41602]
MDPNAIVRQFESADVPCELRSTDRREAVRRVYDHLAAKKLRYETAAIDFAQYNEFEQIIRPPGSMVTDGGNCLELSLVFAGMCLHHKLRALVVLLDDHALVAVWLGGGLEAVWDDGGAADRDYLIMSRGLGNIQPQQGDLHSNLIQLVEKEQEYLLVECTGFARSGGYGARTLSFDVAVAEGLDRVKGSKVTDIVDIAFQYRHRTQRPNCIPEQSLSQPAAAAAPETVPGLWLSDIGRDGLAAALRDSVAAIPESDAYRAWPRWSRPDIAQLLDMLSRAPQCLERDRLVWLAQGLDLALDAGEFITAWMPRAATEKALRRALLACTNGLGDMTPQGLSQHLDAVILRRPACDADGRMALLSFILRLAAEAGIDTEDQAFTNWCRDNGYDIGMANNLRQELKEQMQGRHQRLLIHLRGGPGHDWPEEGQAWLLDETTGQRTPSPPLRCAPHADGVAALLGDVLVWADGFLSKGRLLRRVDIAMPARTLLCWRAEETNVDIKLGAHHEVVVHWGDRMHLPQHMQLLARQASHRLRETERQDQACGRIDWVSLNTAYDQSAFEEDLKNNAYPAALGLRFAPIGQEDWFETLLARFPILLWPGEPVPEWTAVEAAVREQWVNLPGGFTTAYRTAWTGRGDAPPPLARLRAVWEDDNWLEFCREMSGHRAGIASASGAETGGQP